MAQIRVLQVVNSLEIGGAEKVALNLAHYIEKKGYKSYVCTLCGLGPFSEDLIEKGIPVMSLKKKPIPMPGLIFFNLIKFLRQNKIDIITTHNTGPLLYTYWASRFFKKAKILHVDHARDYPRESRQYPSYKFLSKRLHKIISVSEELRENLIKYEQISPEKIRTVLNGIDEEPFLSVGDSDLKKRELGIPLDTDRKILGLAVRLSEQKGITYLIKAISILSKKRDDFCLLIAGDGPLRQSLEQEAKDLDVFDKMVFAGERTDVPEIISLLDIYILPSLWEGLPLAILEAQAAKKPTIATDVGGTANAIQEGISGFLVQPKDPGALAGAIEKLLDDPVKRSDFGKAGYVNFKNNFSIEISADRYIEEYEEMMS